VLVDLSRHDEIERLYREHRDRMWRAVFAFAGDREVANDAVSEAFTQALRRGDAIRSPERWIWRTAFRVAAGELKRRRVRPHEHGSAVYEMDELASDLVTALRRLSEKQRAAVAHILGSSPAAVHVQLSRGRKRLRELLETDDA
jgi:RNA polymerase sigma-70 factor (ECF subfamily)